jgi:hypothetical protein
MGTMTIETPIAAAQEHRHSVDTARIAKQAVGAGFSRPDRRRG